MKNILIQAEVVSLLRERQGKVAQGEFATSIGISKQYLSDLYAGRRSPGPAILDYLRLEKVFRRKKAVKP